MTTDDLAAEWYARLRVTNLDPSEGREFVAWLKASQANVSAYLQIAGIDGDLRAAEERARRMLVSSTWSLVESASSRDLAVYADESLPLASRLKLTGHRASSLPEEAMLKFMAKFERERRSKRRERIWWIVGLIATGLAAPLLVEYGKGLASAL